MEEGAVCTAGDAGAAEASAFASAALSVCTGPEETGACEDLGVSAAAGAPLCVMSEELCVCEGRAASAAEAFCGVTAVAGATS